MSWEHDVEASVTQGDWIWVFSLEEMDHFDSWKLGHATVCDSGNLGRVSVIGMRLFFCRSVCCIFTPRRHVTLLADFHLSDWLIGATKLVLFDLCFVPDPTQMLNHVTRDETTWDIENKHTAAVRYQSLHRVGLCGVTGAAYLFWISSASEVVVSSRAAVWLHSFLNVSNLANVSLDVLMYISVKGRPFALAEKGEGILRVGEEIFSKRTDVERRRTTSVSCSCSRQIPKLLLESSRRFVLEKDVPFTFECNLWPLVSQPLTSRFLWPVIETIWSGSCVLRYAFAVCLEVFWNCGACRALLSVFLVMYNVVNSGLQPGFQIACSLFIYSNWYGIETHSIGN